MAKTVKAMKDETRLALMNKIMEYLNEQGEDIGMSASNEFNLPVVLENGDEAFVVVKVSLPNGSRDGEPYDGYAMRDEYTQKLEDKKEKAKVAAEAKARKIAQDEKRRAKLAASKAQHNK